VACSSDFECNTLGADFACRDGQCRTSTPSVDTCTGDQSCGDDEASLPEPNAALPSGGTDFKQLALGATHGCALRNDGRVFCWGSADLGELGTQGPPFSHASAQEVPGLSDGMTLYAGDSQSCLKQRNGAISCWGDEFLSEGGTVGGYGSRTIPPTTIDALGSIAEMSLGTAFACARLAAGDVRCWGRNYRGELGDGTRDSRAGAESALSDSVAATHAAQQLSSGWNHSCALDATGAVYCWGAELLSVDFAPSDGDLLSAVRIALGDVVKVDVGLTHACALVTGGSVSCWGKNDYGQLGDGSTHESETPIAVKGLRDAVDIALGDSRSCALKANGQVACWGKGMGGGLGNGKESDQSAPVLVATIADAYAIDTGRDFSCALSRSRRILCWGSNNFNELGDGTSVARTRPAAVVIDE
jgi:alpha-tubulin suppressor-like RCC1 family protein